MTRRARAVVGTACGTHFVHDGFSDILYALFPVWAREFGLSFAQVDPLRTIYSGGMATFQIPAGLLAERWGEARLLAAGMAATALDFVAAGFAGGYAVFYTVGVGASALSPSVYRGVSDWGRVPLTLRVVGSLVVLTLPLTLLLRGPLAASPA